MAAALLLDASRRAPRRQAGLRGGAEGRGRRLRRRDLREVGRAASSSSSTSQPFQNGFLGFKNPQAVGDFGDGKAAMILAISELLPHAEGARGRQEGHPRRQARLVRLPGRARRQGRADRHARRHQRLAGHQGRAEGGGRLPEVLHLARTCRRGWRPATSSSRSYKGADDGHRQPLHAQHRRRTSAQSKYHQNFYDQMLGPSVGRVVNDAIDRDRRRQHDAEGGRQGHQGRLEAGQLSTDAGGRACRPVVHPPVACGVARTPCTPWPRRNRRRRDGQLPAVILLPAAGAAAVHAVRGAADRRGRLVQRLQLERLRQADELGRPRQLPLRVRDARLRARAPQQPA